MYLNLLMMFLAAGFIGALALLVGGLLGPKKGTENKLAAYESGIAASGSARERFPVHFYLVAMLFIVFDIETVFLVPWGAFYRQLSCAVPLAAGACPAGQASFFGLGEMLVFMAILVVGLVYVWRKGALQWD